jgi:small conductance mechanosensitive channel
VFLQIVPACAADVGSWCERIFTGTGVSWLAENAAGVVRAAGRILLIIALALLARWIGKRAIGRATRVKQESSTPQFLRPLKARADVLVLGSQGVARRNQRAGSIGSLLVSILSFTIWTVAIILILAEVGINVAPLLASAGIAGVALGFGAQNLVKDFLSGISMLLEDQYGVGDVVDTGLGKGTVESVSLRITRLRDVNGVVWYVRNGEITRIGNETQNWGRAVLDIPVAPDQSIAMVRDLLNVTAVTLAADPDWEDLILEEPSVWGVQAITNDATVVRITLKTAPGKQGEVARELRERVKSAFDESGVALAPLT